MAMVNRARLSWRLPPRARRCRWVLPLEAGTGCGAGVRRERGGAAEVTHVVGFAQDLGRDERTDTGNGDQVLVWAQLEGGGDVGLHRFDLTGEGVQPADRRERKLGPHRLAGSAHQGQAPSSPQRGLADQSPGHLAMARRQPKEQRMESVPYPGLLVDQLVTRADQQLQLSVKVSNVHHGQVGFAECDSGDDERVAFVVLAGSATPAAALGRQVRRDVHNRLAGAEQPLREQAAVPLSTLDGTTRGAGRDCTQPTRRSSSAAAVPAAYSATTRP